jgi:hypothetical protein
MTKDNPMSVDELSDLEEAIDDFYALRGYVPNRIYLEKDSYDNIFKYPFFYSKEEFDLWTPNGSTILVRTDRHSAQMSFNYGGYGNYNNDYGKKKKCCDKPVIIKNDALGKTFYVCRTCKKETDKDGYEIKP